MPLNLTEMICRDVPITSTFFTQLRDEAVRLRAEFILSETPIEDGSETYQNKIYMDGVVDELNKIIACLAAEEVTDGVCVLPEHAAEIVNALYAFQLWESNDCLLTLRGNLDKF